MVIVKGVDGRDKPGHDIYDHDREYCYFLFWWATMPSIRISLFEDSYEPFCELLKASNIEFSERPPPIGKIMAAASTIEILTSVGAILTPIAAVLIAWIRSKSSRKVMITNKKNEVLHVVQGMSVKEIEQILQACKQLIVIDADAKNKK